MGHVNNARYFTSLESAWTEAPDRLAARGEGTVVMLNDRRARRF